MYHAMIYLLNTGDVTLTSFAPCLNRYDQKPEDFFVVENTPGRSEREGQAGSASHVKQSLNRSMFNTLSHYLVHHRWVWSVQLANSIPLSLYTVGKMLQTLTK